MNRKDIRFIEARSWARRGARANPGIRFSAELDGQLLIRWVNEEGKERQEIWPQRLYRRS